MVDATVPTPALELSIPRRRMPPHFRNSLDPLLKLDIPDELCQFDDELARDLKAVQARTKALFNDGPIPTNNEANCIKFVEDVHTIALAQTRVIKRARAVSADLDRSGENRSKRKKIDSILHEQDLTLLTLRSEVNRGQRRISNTMFAQTREANCAEAFMHAMISMRKIEYPCGVKGNASDYLKNHKEDTSRDSNDQKAFQNLCELTYSVPKQEDRPETWWCPVAHGYQGKGQIKAAHIIPWAVRPFFLAQLLCDDYDEVFHYNLLYSADNGMLLGLDIERALDTGSVVIVPADNDETGKEYKLIVLVPSKLNEWISGGSNIEEKHQKFVDVDGRNLLWLNDRRPSRRHLYVRYLMTRGIRRYFQAEGWENDIEKCPDSSVWGDVGKMKEGVVRALAEELGGVRYEDMLRTTLVGESLTKDSEVNDGMVGTGLAADIAHHYRNSHTVE